MDLHINLNINQLIIAIRNLPLEKKIFVKTLIDKELSKTKNDNNLKKLLLSGPVMTDEQYKKYKLLRKDFKAWSKNLSL